VYGLFFGLLMLVYGINSFLLKHDTDKLAQLNAELTSVRLNFIDVAAKYPRSEISPQILDSSRQPMCNIKFSNYLEAFAQAIVPGVWLTEINITDNGKQITLQGHSLKPVMVQLYLQQLKQLAMFAPMTFQILDLSEDKSTLNFQLTARAPDAHIQ
jgi:hypothetical protein